MTFSFVIGGGGGGLAFPGVRVSRLRVGGYLIVPMSDNVPSCALLGVTRVLCCVTCLR